MDIKIINLGKEKFAKIGSHLVYIQNEELVSEQVTECFSNEAYFFESKKTCPLIVDIGSEQGISVLYFKHLYPKSKIVCFGVDERNELLFERNLRANNIKDVHLIMGGPQEIASKIGNFFGNPIDFLKINLPGHELSLLNSLGKKIKNLNEMVCRVEETAVSELKKYLSPGFVVIITDQCNGYYLVRAKRK